MPLKARITVRFHCAVCDQHYDAALGFPTIGILIARSILPPFMVPNYIPVLAGQVPAPEGWSVDENEARCPEHVLPPRGTELPTPDVVKRAEALRSLALDGSTTDGERRNARAHLERLWRKYWLPDYLNPG